MIEIPASPKLFVTNLPPDVTEEDLRAIFGKYGKVLELSLHEPTAGKNVAQAHIGLDSVASSTAALQSEQGKLIKRHTMLIMYAKERPMPPGRCAGSASNRLFLGRLPPNTTKQDLCAALEGVAGVRDIKLNQRRCYAHVNFEDKVCAAAAHDMFSRGTASVRGYRIFVDFDDYARVSRPQDQDPGTYCLTRISSCVLNRGIVFRPPTM